MTVPLVLVTAPQFDKARDYFSTQTDLEFRRAPEAEADLIAAIAASGTHLLVVGGAPYDGALYAALQRQAQGPSLIARYGVGYDNFNLALSRHHQVSLTNTPGVLDQAVAEFTLTLMLALARRLAEHHQAMQQDIWQPRSSDGLRGRVLCVVGFGQIGRAVARASSLAFGLRVQVVGRRPGEEMARQAGRPLAAWLAEHGVESYGTDLEAGLAAADLVSLHLPGSKAPLLTRERLARLRPGALLINTARGSLVDEVALYDALAAGHLAGAALDVFAQEPYRPAAPGKDLRHLPQVICTPHIASNTRDTNRRMAERAATNLRAFLRDPSSPPDLIN